MNKMVISGYIKKFFKSVAWKMGASNSLTGDSHFFDFTEGMRKKKN